MRVLTASRVAGLVGHFDREPAYRGLAEAIRVLVTDGRIPAGVRLPSERDLTVALGVSRTTVTRAYATLRDQGYLTSRQGSGSVAALPEAPGGRIDHVLHPGDHPGALDLTTAAPPAGPGLMEAYERALAELPGHLAASGYHPSGLPVLREAVAEWFGGRGLPTSADQVMIVPGAQAGVAIAARALLRRGRRALVESPTYPNAIAALRHSGVRLVGIDIGPAHSGDHADVAVAVDTARQARAAAAYLIPDFHNPTGQLMSDRSRAALARALRDAGTTPIVDESMVELALDDQEMPRPFGCHHPDTITVGSMSKPYWGGLRIGWVRAPHRQQRELFTTRLSLDLGAAVLEQLVAADLLTHGQGLLEHRRHQLRASRDAALAAVAEQLPEWRVRRPGGGLSLWCELPAGGPGSSALVPVAEAQGVLLVAGPNFAPEGGLDRFVRLPYSAPAAVVTEAVGRVAGAWSRTTSSGAKVASSPLVA